MSAAPEPRDARRRDHLTPVSSALSAHKRPDSLKNPALVDRCPIDPGADGNRQLTQGIRDRALQALERRRRESRNPIGGIEPPSSNGLDQTRQCSF